MDGDVVTFSVVPQQCERKGSFARGNGGGPLWRTDDKYTWGEEDPVWC